MYQISCRNCDAIYIGETGRSVKTRKKEHVSAARNFDSEKSALCQHVLEHDHVIDWENVKILKSEPHANRRRTAKSFLINQKVKEFSVLNRNDGAILPGVYKTLSKLLIVNLYVKVSNFMRFYLMFLYKSLKWLINSTFSNLTNF